MGENRYMGQLKGPFKANQELFELIKADAAIDIQYVEHLGIQTDVSAIVIINNKEYEIGKTGIYEIGNTDITSIMFKADTDDNTLIDYTIE